MSSEHTSEPGDAEFHNPLETPSDGEQKLAFAHRFGEVAAEVSDAESQLATEEFQALVENFMLHHAGQVQVDEWVEGYPTSSVTRKQGLPDGSDVRVTVVTRGEGIPKAVRGTLPGEPMEVFVRTFNANIPSRQLFYRLDGNPLTLRRQEDNDPMGVIMRALDAVDDSELDQSDLEDALEASLDPQRDAVDIAANPIAQHIANETANQELEGQLGVNNRKVGVDEVSGLRQLLTELS